MVGGNHERYSVAAEVIVKTETGGYSTSRRPKRQKTIHIRKNEEIATTQKSQNVYIYIYTHIYIYV